MKGVVRGLIIGGVIVALGIVIILVTLGVNDWHINENEGNYEMKSYTAEQECGALEISIGAGTLVTEFYDGDRIVIDYPDSNSLKTGIEFEEGKLSYHSKPKWYKILFGANKIPQTVVKLPKTLTIDITLDISAGSLTLADGAYKNVTLNMSAGSFRAGRIECGEFDFDMSAGSAGIDEVVCGKFICDVSAGSMKTDKLTADETDVDISAGSVKLNMTGAQSEYGITTDVSAGSCNVSSQTGETNKRINVDVSAGSVTIGFNA